MDELVLLRMKAAGAADPLRVVSEGPDIDAMVDFRFEYADDEIVIPDHLRAGLTRPLLAGRWLWWIPCALANLWS